ncbi:hypothetical protein [Neptunicella marina]|uniref:DUF4194 domain-containing protein n=1 Tax=Neptunicella marina TaxID=2125989 RepID=A0A8J6IUZ1_9ALTE|nr:hypothetical protein [Neptunicella marina]MBC3765973.1 hypothetical protein [Neptunicella marina]
MMNEQGRALEQLLSGAFICQTSDETLWRVLKNNDYAEKIEQQLNVLNRTLTSCADGEVFYAAYQHLGDDERKVLGTQFQETAAGLLPMVEWLLLVQQAVGNDMPLTQGQAIRLPELQTQIEDTPAFKEQLQKIARYRLFNSLSTEVDGQLKQLFKKLTDMGYLIRPNPEKQIYLATGKVDYLFDVLKFIDETEALSLSQQAEQAAMQESLL